MKNIIEDYNTIAKQLKSEYPNMSDYEILSLSIQIERNQLLENGLCVSTSDKNPSALEAVAIALGFTDKQSGLRSTVTDVLREIANKEAL